LSRGALAAEAHLLDELHGLARACAADPSLLRNPVLVIAASRSLREHLSARLVERCGRAVAGIAIQTLSGLVASILSRAGERGEADDALFAALVRQLAREEPSLREPLDDLKRGYAPVVGEVADLLDAGLESAHADAVLEVIGSPARSPLAKRAAAVVRVAARASERLRGSGVGHLSARLRRARERLDAEPERVLGVRAVYVFGFADATGLQMDLIETLLRRCGACVYLDFPPDPDEPTRADPGVAFSDRFGARLRGAPGVETLERSETPERPEIQVLGAPALDAELRGVANRVREALDAGARPERIAVVARNLDLYRGALQVQFGRLGIPMSGVDARSAVEPATRRRILALQALLVAGPRASIDLWLDLLGALPSSERRPVALGAAERADLRLAFHASGVGRLADAARLEAHAEVARLRLPRSSLSLAEDGTPTAPRREIPSWRLAEAASAARRVSDRLASWSDRAALSEHLDALRRLVTEQLGWSLEEPSTEFLAQIEATAGGGFELDREDFRLYFGERTERDLALPIGGEGGGVAVLSVEQARSRTFERLFLIGLNRGIFPRPIAEDPLLPDGLRRRMRAVLPDLPVKREGYDEERFLFAQLLSSSPKVTLSYSALDEDGRRRCASPLVERLRSCVRVELPAFWQPAACDGSPALRTAYEHAQLAGLFGTRDQFAHALRVALDERSACDPDAVGAPGASAAALRAAARIAVLDEWEARGDRRREAGPYCGFLGSIALAADPRRAPLYVTGVEQIARCAWQAFLVQLLRVEPLPDALAELPAAEAPIVGNLVHGALHEIVAEHLAPGPGALDEVAGRAPLPIPRPDGDRLREFLTRRARAILRAEGIATPGFERVLVDRAHECVQRALELDWPAEGVEGGALGAEVEGSVAFRDGDGAERELRFRADRVDRIAGVLCCIDYKTGKAVADLKRPDSRRRHLLSAVARGTALQAAAYSLGGTQIAGDRAARGRYLYLGANTPEFARIAEVESEDADFSEALERTARVAFEAWDRGSLTPRLIDASDGKEPRRCSQCAVKEGCLRGDSGSRYRLERWLESARSAEPAKRLDAERAAIQLWNLGRSPA